MFQTIFIAPLSCVVDYSACIAALWTESHVPFSEMSLLQGYTCNGTLDTK